MKISRRVLLLLACAGVVGPSDRLVWGAYASPHQAAASPVTSGTLNGWGLEALTQIRSELYLASRQLYAEETKAGETITKTSAPAVMWGCGVQLSALVAAGRIDSDWKPRVVEYVQGLDRYWTDQNLTVIGGYDVLPGPKPLDRYYDDNAWLVLALAEGYDVTGNAGMKARAERTLNFVLSGEDKRLGGGIYWHEQEKKSKNTCSNAPGIVAVMRVYQLTRRAEYLVTARRLYFWTNEHLQDTDGLYWDNIKLDGMVDKTKWSYNTALMIRANCLLYQETREKFPQEARGYLEEARRVALAAEAHWVNAETGAIADEGKFAHLLCESFLTLSETDPDAERVTHWRNLVRRTAIYLHSQLRDTNGHYASRWDKPPTESITKVPLIDQASAARTFLLAAKY